ncbi:hypothetical protein CEUSTIGMA_g10445.t1 [Chlamydomonas eustigma]|uniref:Transcription initiation factor TFIID subunit 12 domain-containing protein n=1 Tax=Chlamydomonas eustigma TaxID=1157962 RepID=A0A250XIW5_9CHLO|nr:hypothetical protein CEUSTIGMA_g10445.t1 [Chlamydomonas eustigma]|eukprot:GAX83018.1 hypothetical protein CEUSTIGMA_g10445.t1 [Chlamydomonas eustigma]
MSRQYQHGAAVPGQQNFMIPAQQQGNVSMIPAQQQGSVNMIPAQQQGSVNMIPAQQQGSVNMIPAQQQGYLNMIPAQQQGSVNMIPAQQQGNVNMIPAQRGGVNMIPAQQQGSVNMVPVQQRGGMVSAQAAPANMVPTHGTIRMTPAQQQGAPNMVPAQQSGAPNMVPAQVSYNNGMVPAQGRVNMVPAQGNTNGGITHQQQQQYPGRPGPNLVAPGTSSFQKPGGPSAPGPMQASPAAHLQNVINMANALLNSQQAAANAASFKNLTAAGAMGLGQLGRPGGPGFPMPGVGGLPRPNMMMMPPKRRYPPDDERRIMPRRGLDYALKAAGLESKFKLDMSTEAVLEELYEEVIGNAISFGCSNAKRRKSTTLVPRDMAVYLERTWNLYVPGFGADQLRPYRRTVASKLHEARQRAARQLAVGAEASEDAPETGKK